MPLRLLITVCVVFALLVDTASAVTFNQFDVSITEYKFAPKKTVAIAPDDRVQWTNDGTLTHTATGSPKLGYWDSGDIAPGGMYLQIFETAGSFAYRCTIHPRKMRGSIKIPTVVFPATGNEATMFTITWSAPAVPAGYNVDVQIKRPRRRGYKNFMTDQMGAMNGAAFMPDKGTGVYKFRSRLQNDTNNAHSGWSPAGVITVS